MKPFPLGVRDRRVLAAAVLAVVLVVVGWRHVGAGKPASLRVAPISPTHTAPVVAARRLVVDVVGAVRAPGLVRLPEGARVADAIAAAGGLGGGAERAGVNFAAPVADGQQVIVPRRGAGVAPAGASAASGPVSLSSASPEQLDALPGVGPVTAEKIVAYRQAHGSFRSVDELDAISGIGPARIGELRGLVVP